MLDFQKKKKKKKPCVFSYFFNIRSVSVVRSEEENPSLFWQRNMSLFCTKFYFQAYIFLACSIGVEILVCAWDYSFFFRLHSQLIITLFLPTIFVITFLCSPN